MDGRPRRWEHGSDGCVRGKLRDLETDDCICPPGEARDEGSPAEGSSIRTAAFDPRPQSRSCSRLRVHCRQPSTGPPELAVSVVGEFEVQAGQPVKRSKGIGQSGEVETRVVLAGQGAQLLEPVALSEGGHVDEVPGLGPGEERQELGSGQVFVCEDWPERALLGRASAVVVAEVNEGRLAFVADHDAGEPLGHPIAGDGEACGGEGFLRGGKQSSHRGGFGGEEVKVPAPPASAKSSASGRAVMIRAVRSCSWLSTPNRRHGARATTPPRLASREARGGASATAR